MRYAKLMTYFWMSHFFFSISVENHYMLLGKEHIDASILLHPNMRGGGNRVQILNSPGLRFVTLVMYFSWRTLSFLSYKV